MKKHHKNKLFKALSILFIFFCHVLYGQKDEDITVYSLNDYNSSSLFIGIDNSVIVSVADIPTEILKVKINQGSIESKDGKYIVKVLTEGFDTLKIYRGDSLIGIKPFEVRVPPFQNHKEEIPNDSVMTKDEEMSIAFCLSDKAELTNRLSIEQKKVNEDAIKIVIGENQIMKQKIKMVVQSSILEKLNMTILNHKKEMANQESEILKQKYILSDQLLEIKNTKSILWITFAIIIIILSLMIFSIKSYLQKKKDNFIITKQKEIVEKKNNEITKSIEYALRIQTAILPTQKIIKQYLENSFILYKPKDIVAGDFYWMETIQFEDLKMSQFENEKDNGQPTLNFQTNEPLNKIILFAACDCTGHGVPGAMVSVVCHNALNRAVREFGLIKPSAILDKTAELVIENFSKSEDEIKDGMDISLCAYNTKTKILQWAGANNPLWLINNGELIETKGDKRSIGNSENVQPFTNHQFSLNAGEHIFIFTDGFADQFGGVAEKKVTKRRFKELLLSIQNTNMQEQGTALEKFIVQYRKEIEQTDDILVMGVSV